MLQQHLPFTVLKHPLSFAICVIVAVATVLTVYGIETSTTSTLRLSQETVATVLTVYGIETGITAENN